MFMSNCPSIKFQIIYDTIKEDHNILNISELCKIAGVSRAGFYKWIDSQGKLLSKEEQDKADFQLILQAYQFSGYDKGVRGLYMRLCCNECQENP